MTMAKMRSHNGRKPAVPVDRSGPLGPLETRIFARDYAAMVALSEARKAEDADRRAAAMVAVRSGEAARRGESIDPPGGPS